MDFNTGEMKMLREAISNEIDYTEMGQEYKQKLEDLDARLREEIAKQSPAFHISYIINFDDKEVDYERHLGSEAELREELGELPAWLEEKHKGWTSVVATLVRCK